MKLKFTIDRTGIITQITWCAEQGEHIERIIGHIDDFSLSELQHMNIQRM